MMTLIALYGLLLTGTSADGQVGMREYSEDLSAHRTLFATPIVPYERPLYLMQKPKVVNFVAVHDITSRLQQLLIDLKEYDKMAPSIAGYTIQGYTGTNRQLAFQVKEQLCTHFDHLNAEVQYKQPNFSVQIGRFLDRLEAYPLYLRIKKFLPQAIIRPASFPNKPDIFECIQPVELPDASLNGKTEDSPEQDITAEGLAEGSIENALSVGKKSDQEEDI
jgi:hypothetical protein